MGNATLFHPTEQEVRTHYMISGKEEMEYIEIQG